MSALGDRLKALRDDKELTTAQLAEAAGIDESTMTAILSGDIARPPDERLRGLADLLDVSFDDLLNLIPESVREAHDSHGIPKLGVFGGDAVREAVERSFTEIEEQLRARLRELFKMTGDEDPWPWIVALFPDRFVAQRDGKFWRYSYSMTDGGEVKIGTPEQVVQTWQPVGGSTMTEALASAFLEATADDGRGASRFTIRVVRAGLSGNGNYYPDAVLRESLPLFDGARVFAKSDEEHLRGKGKDVRNLIGRIAAPSFVEGRGVDHGEIRATLEMLEPSGDVAVKLREALDRGMSGLFGFSINAAAMARKTKRAGRPVREATKFTRVESVDLIVEPGAGGELINLIEAKGDDVMWREKLIKAIEAKRPALLKGKKVDELTDEDLEQLLTEALEGEPAGEPGTGDHVPVLTREDLDAVVATTEARAHLREALADSPLPEPARNRVRGLFADAERFTEAEVDAAIQAERDYLSNFTESGHVVGLGDAPRIEIGETRFEKVQQMLDAFFDPSHKDHRHARSFKECYVAVTGDKRVTGQLRHCDESLMREALSSGSWADVLGDSITRRMIADYRLAATPYGAWREVSSVVPISDFRTQERTRFGGYGDLPAVAEDGAYTALTSPTDEKATYAVTKRGGTETISMEMIKNDDVGAIQRIPIKLSRAAQRTLGKFVLDFLRTNPVIYDGVALFHATHNNLSTAALASGSLSTARVSMVRQTEKDSGEEVGIGPRNLLVPAELEETGVDLFRRNTENDRNFVQSLSLNVLPVWYWTDTNDWVVTADVNDVPLIEVGFLDGQEEPEIFVQDSPTVGSMFSNDQLKYKIRHIYGGTVVDFRGAHKAVVV